MEDIFKRKITRIKQNNNHVKFDNSSTKNSTLKEVSNNKKIPNNLKKKGAIKLTNANYQKKKHMNKSFVESENLNKTHDNKDINLLKKKKEFYSSYNKSMVLNEDIDNDNIDKKNASFFFLNKKKRKLPDFDSYCFNDINFMKKKVDKLTPLPSYKNSDNNKHYKKILKSSIMQRRLEYDEKLKQMKYYEACIKQIEYIQLKWKFYFKTRILGKILLIQKMYRRYKEIKLRKETINYNYIGKLFVRKCWAKNFKFFIGQLIKRYKTFINKIDFIKLIWKGYFKINTLPKIILIQKVYRKYKFREKLKPLDINKFKKRIVRKCWEINYRYIIEILKSIKKKEEIGIQVETLYQEKINKCSYLKTFPRPYHEIGNNIKILRKRIQKKENIILESTINRISHLKFEGKINKLFSIPKKMIINLNHNKPKNFSSSKDKNTSDNTNNNVLYNNKYIMTVRKKVAFNKWNYFYKIDNYNEYKKLFFIQKEIKKFLTKVKQKKIRQNKRLFHIKLFIILYMCSISKKIRIEIINILKCKYKLLIKKKDVENYSLNFFKIKRGIKQEKLNVNFLNFQTSKKLNITNEQTSTTIINDDSIYINIKECQN